MPLRVRAAGCRLVLLAVGASLAFAAPPARPVRPNVVLITLDTLRADRLGCYGYKQIETPTLDALARDGVVFERAFSQVPLTWPSHAAILTGTYPFQNGVQDFTGQPLDPKFRTVAQAFKTAGYATGAVVSSFVLDRSWGLARGFDFYDDAFAGSDFLTKDPALVERRADASVNHAIAWLERTPRRPFFLWLHLYDPHSPYNPPEPFRTQYHDRLYDGEIAYADHELGRLVAFLKQARLYANTAIVLLSDHGESLGDHGEREHGFFIYNSTVHIPLIVKPAAGNRVPAGKVDRAVEAAAVAPTLLDLAGMKDEITKQFQVRGLFEATPANPGAYSETFYPFSSFGWNPLHGMESERYHYIEAPEPELYDVTADPQESTNLMGTQAATTAVLKEILQKRLATAPAAGGAQAGKLSPEAAEKLRALGYVAYRSPVAAEDLAKGLPDPKSKLWEFNSILQAADAARARDFAAGESLLAAVREKDPKMYIVPFMLGEAALRQQKWDVAAVELQKCLELNPNFDQAMTGLARALDARGDIAGARLWLRKALQFNPQNQRAWYEMGWIEAKSGNADAARAAFEKCLAVQPRFALAHRDLGMLYFQRQEYAEAAKHLAKAVELGLEEASLFNFLGISYSRTNRPRRAAESYRRALALNPGLAEAHLNLGFALARMGDARNAGHEYREACRLHAEFCGAQPKP